MKTSLAIIFSLCALASAIPTTFAAEETCASCGRQVSISGDFTHRKLDDDVKIEGATGSLFREEVSGPNFTLTIAHLPAGKATSLLGHPEKGICR